MKAAILAVGSELLGTERLDTNSLRLTAALVRHGWELVGKSVRGDDEAAMAAELRHLADDADLLLLSGGLGPTADDVTRPAVARAFGLALKRDEALVEDLRERFRRFGLTMADVNLQQADVLEGATVLYNPRGSAPGQRVTVDHGGRGVTLFLFPGVPRELEGFVDNVLEPWLAERSDGRGAETAVFKVAGHGESDVEQRLQPFYEEHGRDGVTVLASPGEVRIELTARGSADERRRQLDARGATVRALLDDLVYTEDADKDLVGAVADLLVDQGLTLTTAESCTGGLLAERLTRISGSSAFFLGGVVSYSNELKMSLLGVPEALLAEHGAVSEPVAAAMAAGACRRLGSDLAVSVTGVAGPTGGSPEKPVGTVHMGIAWKNRAGVHTYTFHKRFIGDRAGIRYRTSQHVLETLRRRLKAWSNES